MQFFISNCFKKAVTKFNFSNTNNYNVLSLQVKNRYKLFKAFIKKMFL